MSFPNWVRYFNKHLLNRLTIKIAGINHSPISIVRHVGRRSGKPFETPVIVEPEGNSFVFALTYGPGVDWYRNVLAAGRCTLLWHGGKYRLENPQSIETEAGRRAFPIPIRWILKVMGTKHFFRMEVSEA